MRAKRLEDLSLKEIRYLMLDKRRVSRNVRLEHFRQTGQVMPPVGDWDGYAGAERGNETSAPIKNRRRTWLDGFLFVVELLAVVALVSVIWGVLTSLRTINENAASTFQQPIAEPTPIIREVVLPDGHTPPNSPGGARPNEAEIPENLRPLMQSLANIPIPTPSSQQAIRIQIPAINVDAPIVQGDGWEQLKKGVAQHIGSPNPGEKGNTVLSGHNDVFGEVFRYLDQLKPGDVVILFTSRRQYTYVITGTQMVAPTAVEVMAPTTDSRITLISCHPYLVDVHRIIISAILQNP